MAQYDNREVGRERLLTPREAAEYLRLNPRTVTRLAREGKLPGVKVGKRWRFQREALAGWPGGGVREASVASIMTAGVEGGVAGEGEGRTFLAGFLRREAVICDLEGVDKRGVLGEIVSRLVEAGILEEGRLFLKLLLEREELMTTSIAEGVAVPHPRRAVVGMFRESVVAVAISKRGVNFAGTGAVPVRVFFVICASDDRAHLRILARISALLRGTTVLERMLGARFPEEVIGVISSEEESLAGEAGLIAG